MPHPQSPHRPSSTDPSGGFGTIQSSKDMFSASLPLHAQGPLRSSTPRLSTETPSTLGTVQEFAPSHDHQSTHTAMDLDDQASLQWPTPTNFLINPMGHKVAGYQTLNSFPPSSEDFCHYTQNTMSYNDNFNFIYPAQYPNSSCPRSYNGVEPTGLPNDISMTESYPPTAYHIEPPKHEPIALSDHDINGQLIQASNDYDHHQYGPQIKVEDDGGYQSPYSDLTRSSAPHDDHPGYPNDMKSEGLVVDKEQPYAQLIYQALLNAPEHTMILRDIYDWFKDHTDKASASETKGWQNSIRHNLSMNGAFEKVDQPCEESHKGFMWRLTETAIRDGVKSTTRYRSKVPNKRGHRTQHPQPQRQASGAKGGQAARRSARMKRSGRMHDTYRNNAYMSRSVPSAFDPCYHSHTAGEPLMQYPGTPYFGTEADFAFENRNDMFGNDVFSPPRSYTGSPLPNGLPILDTAYVLDQSPTASLFTDSPSPSADEPRTPVDQGWADDVGMGAPCVFDEQMSYREYAG